MSVNLSTKKGNLAGRQPSIWYYQYCSWAEAMRDQDYMYMTLTRHLGIPEILERNMMTIKLNMIETAMPRVGAFDEIKWPDVAIGPLKGVEVHVQYDVASMNYRCVLVYHARRHTWQVRFIITERELQNA